MTSKNRKYLEKLAHNLEPIVIIGQNGLTQAVADMCAANIEHHELLKVKYNEFKDQKVELTQELAQEIGAETVRIIGNVAILYRPAQDPTKRKIKLPE